MLFTQSSNQSKPELGHHPTNKLNALEYHIGKLRFYHNEIILIEVNKMNLSTQTLSTPGNRAKCAQYQLS